MLSQKKEIQAIGKLLLVSKKVGTTQVFCFVILTLFTKFECKYYKIKVKILSLIYTSVCVCLCVP